MATNKNFIVKNGLEVGGTATMDGLTVDGNASTTGVLTLGNAGITNAFINSADSLYINIDSNNDQAGGNDFQIGRNSTGTSSQKIFLAGENGDISFYEDTGTTPKLFWDASSESLSIGTNGSTTDRRFQVSGTAASTAATQFGIVANPTYPTNVTGDVYNLYSQPNVASGTTLTSLYNLYLGATGLSGSTITNLYGVYQAGASEKNYFAGNVGIGTSSPSAGIPLTAYYSPTSQMHLGGAGNIVSNNTYFNGTAWVNRNSAVGGAVLQINTNGSFAFRRAGTGASPTLNYSALIDSSGNVLVGKTVNDLTTDGIVLRGSGELFVTRANDVAAFNRRSSDGQIVTIRRDGASVGAIGGQGGALYITGPLAGGLKFSYLTSTNATIFPVTTTGATADGLHDLGYTGSRFRNLYLAGIIDSLGSIVQTTSTTGLVGQFENTSTSGYGIRITTYATGAEYAFAVDSYGGGYSRDFVIGVNGRVYSPPTYAATTGAAANTYVGTDGSFNRSTSSLRYKNTITDATHGLAELLTLRPVTYKSNNDGDIVFGGLIAEEVHDSGLTEFVQYNEEGQPDALAYGNMVSLCIKSMQEQQAIIEALTARLEALEGA